MDLSDLTESRFSTEINKAWAIRLKKISGIHYSPPCETYSYAHHNNNPHRIGTKPRLGAEGILARQHDAMNGTVLKTLGDISIRSKAVISIEQPVCYFQYMPFTKRLLSRPGWMHKQADHCSNRDEDDIIFPRKRTSWFLHSVKPTVPLQLCKKSMWQLSYPTHIFSQTIDQLARRQASRSRNYERSC